MDRDRELAELARVVRLAWPDIEIDTDHFVAYLAERCDPGRPVFSEERAAELYLACACASGDSTAISAFLSTYQRHIDSTVRALGGRDQDIEEVRERVLRFLFVADGARPGIASFAGGGRLASWVRVIAARAGARYLGEEYQDPRRARGGAEEILGALPSTCDPELEHLRARFGDAFRIAFVGAIEELSSRQRNLLRQHYLDRLTLEELAALYRVHRATAARWLASARETLLDETRDRMMAMASVDSSDLDSILRLLHSQIDVSIQRFLAAVDDR